MASSGVLVWVAGGEPSQPSARLLEVGVGAGTGGLRLREFAAHAVAAANYGAGEAVLLLAMAGEGWLDCSAQPYLVESVASVCCRGAGALFVVRPAAVPVAALSRLAHDADVFPMVGDRGHALDAFGRSAGLV